MPHGPKCFALGAAGLLFASVPPSAPAAAEAAAHLVNEPAATLLLPYFEVALPKRPGKKAKGPTTVFSVRNAALDPALVHVVLWSDYGVPVIFFDLYLTGYDAETIDLAAVIDGRLPVTADAARDPGDTLSPQGAFSLDVSFPGCDSVLPPQAQLPPDSVAHMRAALTGKPSPLFGNLCFGSDYGEKKPVARGYVTVDAVNQCSLVYPDSPGYFAGGAGIAANTNVLFGDYAVIDRKKKSAWGGPLVHIRADAGDPLTDGAGDYTFYAGLLGVTGADNRQPLGSTWGARFVTDPKDPDFPGGTTAVVWRDSKVPQTPFPCGSVPSPHPLAQEQIVAFDEAENPEQPMLPAVPPLPAQPVFPFPLATQRVPVGDEAFPVSFARGWLYLNLNTTSAGQNAAFTDVAQSYVTLVLRTKKSATAFPGVLFSSAAGP
jgi:hypothetical protein